MYKQQLPNKEENLPTLTGTNTLFFSGPVPLPRRLERPSMAHGAGDNRLKLKALQHRGGRSKDAIRGSWPYY